MRKVMLPSETDFPNQGPQPYFDMHRERIRAHNKHEARDGSMERKEWYNPIFLSVVVEEVGEIARVLNENESDPRSHVAIVSLREELVQTGAMVAAWIDAIDNRGK